jgi:hypothetical protein
LINAHASTHPTHKLLAALVLKTHSRASMNLSVNS